MTRPDEEREYVAAAAMALTDPFARCKDARLYYIEQALKRDPCPDYRRQIVREYLDLTNPEPTKDLAP